MSDQFKITSGSSQEANLLPVVSAGSLLRGAREEAGLHIAALAASLKVPVSKIEAIEDDRFDMLPDIFFARALASSMCRTLKIDSTPILEKMPSISARPIKTDIAGINTPFIVPGEMLSLSSWRHLSKPLVLAVVMLLFGAMILLLAPLLSKGGDVGTTPSSSAETMQFHSNMLSLSGRPVQTGNAVEAPVPVASTSDVLLARSIVSVDVSSRVSTSSTPLDAASSTIEVSGQPTALLALKAINASWVQVIDSAGVVQVQKTLLAGEAVGVSGKLPLFVVLGRADAVEVQVKGQPFDTATRTRENIARFEVR